MYIIFHEQNPANMEQGDTNKEYSVKSTGVFITMEKAKATWRIEPSIRTSDESADNSILLMGMH